MTGGVAHYVKDVRAPVAPFPQLCMSIPIALLQRVLPGRCAADTCPGCFTAAVDDHGQRACVAIMGAWNERAPYSVYTEHRSDRGAVAGPIARQPM